MKIAEIKDFLSKTELPSTIRIDSGTTIVDVPKFFDSHLHILESEANKKTKMLHYDRIMIAIYKIKLNKNDSKYMVQKDDLDFSAIANIENTSTLKPNTNFENSVEPKFEPKIEPKVEPMVKPKVEQKVEPKVSKKEVAKKPVVAKNDESTDSIQTTLF